MTTLLYPSIPNFNFYLWFSMQKTWVPKESTLLEFTKKFFDWNLYKNWMLGFWFLFSSFFVIFDWNRLEGDNVSMSVVMAPLWVVDLVLVLAPVAMAVTVAVRRLRHGEPVDAMLVSNMIAMVFNTIIYVYFIAVSTRLKVWPHVFGTVNSKSNIPIMWESVSLWKIQGIPFGGVFVGCKRGERGSFDLGLLCPYI